MRRIPRLAPLVVTFALATAAPADFGGHIGRGSARHGIVGPAVAT